MVPIGRPAVTAVDNYLVRGRPELAVRGRGIPALFLNARGGRLSRQSAWQVLSDAAERAGIDAADVARKPTSLSFEEAAAVPLVALAAWQALVDVADVLVVGAGGLGLNAIAVLKAKGTKLPFETPFSLPLELPRAKPFTFSRSGWSQTERPTFGGQRHAASV